MPNHRRESAGCHREALPFMFATGVENSAPTIENGKLRRHLMAECGHYEHWKTDFARTAELGVRWLRYGVPLYRTWLGPGRYDWEFADLAFAELRRLGIEPIADLCHFSVPDWIGNFQNPDFPALFKDYAGAFAQRYPWVRLYTPVNEIYICARSSALYGWWNEQEQSPAAYVRALHHLARANVLAMHEILRHRRDALFVQSESTEYFHAAVPGAVTLSNDRNERRFLSLDLNYGRPLEGALREYVLDNGMRDEDLRFFREHALRDCCILGTDYYESNEHHVQENGEMGLPDGLLGYAAIAHEYWQRYGVPLMHTETNRDQEEGGDEASAWLRHQWMLVRSLMHCGVPMLGFTWYALTDQVDWDIHLREQRGKVNPRGLVDLERRVRPVGDAYRALIATWTGHV